MSVESAASPGRLRQLRALDGLKVEEAAEIFCIPKSTYSAVERGDRVGELDAQRAGYSSNRLSTLPDMSEPLHRQRASIGVRVQEANREQLRLAGELMHELRSDNHRTPEVAIIRATTPTELADLDDIAEDCRYMLGLTTNEPIGNLTSAAERAGVCITPIHDVELGTSKRVDGLSAWVEGQPTVGINPDSSGDRFRLTLAHELGHLLMHHKPTAVTEDEANMFASTLLVPTDAFHEAIGPSPTLRDFIALKNKWGISIAAGIYRAQQTGIIDPDRYRSLQIQTSKWRKSEPHSFEIRPGRLLPRLAEASGGVEAVAKTYGIAPRHVAITINWERRRRNAFKLITGAGNETESQPRRARLRSV